MTSRMLANVLWLPMCAVLIAASREADSTWLTVFWSVALIIDVALFLVTVWDA